MGALVIGAAGLVVVKAVILKMLPFDNKSEFQVVVDMPEGTTLETTNALLHELSGVVAKVPEVKNYQGYAGTASPITFNGLVRQYYLRSGPIVGDLQVNLVDKHERKRQSHAIALAVRPALQKIAKQYGASLKVVEVPPGPPVLAPIVAEVYGPDYGTVRKIATGLEKDFKANHDIVDVDTSVEANSPREVVVVDRERAAKLGLSQAGHRAGPAHGAVGRRRHLHDGRPRALRGAGAPAPVAGRPGLAEPAAGAARARAVGRPGAAVGGGQGALGELGEGDLPQGPAALRLRHRRRCRVHRQPAVRHVLAGRQARPRRGRRPSPVAVLHRPAVPAPRITR